MRLIVFMAVLLNHYSIAFASTPPILAEAFLARVGPDAVLLSDLVRFRELESILSCAGMGDASVSVVPLSDATTSLLDRYIEEELIYQEARTRSSLGGTQLRKAIGAIQDKKKCLQQWRELGERFTKIWASPGRPREGEARLVRELEKRLMIKNFEKEQMQGDRSIWIRSARIKTPIKLFLD
jgi:hypothetical protein